MMRSEQTTLGLVLIVTGLLFASLTGAIMKLLADDLHPLQISGIRFLGLLLIVLPVILRRFGRAALRPPQLGLQVLRGVTMVAATVAFIVGVRTVDFADAIAILYAYPFLLTVLAAVYLGERVRWLIWLGVAGGFGGVLLVMRPEFDSLDSGALLVFLCAAIISVQMALNRKLGLVTHPLVTTMWGSLTATVMLLCLVPFFWQPIGAHTWWPIVALVISGALNHLLIVFAFAKASASTLAPVTYFEIVAAVPIGYAIFGTLPTWISVIGMLLIFSSGLIVARSSRA